MCNDKKSDSEELYKSLMGNCPNKQGEAYEKLSSAVANILSGKSVRHNVFIKGLSGVTHQLDGLVNGNIAIETKDNSYGKGHKVKLSDLQQMEGALTDLSQIDGAMIFSSTGFTGPASEYADATSNNERQTEIVPVIGRPSTKEDETGRVKCCKIDIVLVDFDFKNAKYTVLWKDEDEKNKVNQYLSTLECGKYRNRLTEFYDKEGNIILDVKNLSDQLPEHISANETKVEGVFNISAYVKLVDRLFAIKGIKYEIPIVRESETFTIGPNSEPVFLVKSEKLGINKLITEKDLKKALESVNIHTNHISK